MTHDLAQPFAVEKPKQNVDIWEKIGGKVQILECPWGLLKVKERYPKSLDPVQVVEDYLKVIDIEGTKLLQKMRQPATVAVARSSKAKGSRKPNLKEPGKCVGRHHSLKVFDERVKDIYRRLPNEFSGRDLWEYFKTAYAPTKVSDDTARNKVYAYTNFLKLNGYLEKVGTDGKAPIYRFIKAPFGACKPAQPEFDQEYAKQQMSLELEAMRRTA